MKPLESRPKGPEFLLFARSKEHAGYTLTECHSSLSLNQYSSGERNEVNHQGKSVAHVWKLLPGWEIRLEGTRAVVSLSAVAPRGWLWLLVNRGRAATRGEGRGPLSGDWPTFPEICAAAPPRLASNRGHPRATGATRGGCVLKGCRRGHRDSVILFAAPPLTPIAPTTCSPRFRGMPPAKIMTRPPLETWMPKNCPPDCECLPGPSW